MLINPHLVSNPDLLNREREGLYTPTILASVPLEAIIAAQSFIPVARQKMPITRLYGVFVLLAIVAAVSIYILHRRWIPPIADSTTPIADTLYIVLLGLIGAPLTHLLRGGSSSFVIASLLAAALLFGIAYGRAFHKGDRSQKALIAKRFASSMVLGALLLLVVATATGWRVER